MPTYLFQKLSKQARAEGVNLKQIDTAREWFRNAAKQIRTTDGNKILKSDPNRFLEAGGINNRSYGKMMMFFYDATTKEDLPYWDRFPLIFPVKKLDDGFLGINLHYLHPMSRAKLMDALYTTQIGKQSETKRLQITYRILNSATKFRLFKPCVKRYKWAGLRSRLFVVRYEEWDMMLMLPMERFDTYTGGGVSRSKVWADSMKKLSRI